MQRRSFLKVLGAAAVVPFGLLRRALRRGPVAAVPAVTVSTGFIAGATIIAGSVLFLDDRGRVVPQCEPTTPPASEYWTLVGVAAHDCERGDVAELVRWGAVSGPGWGGR